MISLFSPLAFFHELWYSKLELKEIPRIGLASFRELSFFCPKQFERGWIRMIKVLAHFRLKDGVLPQVKALAEELVAATRQEEGCIQYELLQAAENTLHLVMQEAWASQAALDAHSASAHFMSIVPQLAALCTQPPEVEQYAQLV